MGVVLGDDDMTWTDGIKSWKRSVAARQASKRSARWYVYVPRRNDAGEIEYVLLRETPYPKGCAARLVKMWGERLERMGFGYKTAYMEMEERP